MSQPQPEKYDNEEMAQDYPNRPLDYKIYHDMSEDEWDELIKKQQKMWADLPIETMLVVLRSYVSSEIGEVAERERNNLDVDYSDMILEGAAMMAALSEIEERLEIIRAAMAMPKVENPYSLSPINVIDMR